MKHSLGNLLWMAVVSAILSMPGHSSQTLEPEQQFAWAWTLAPDHDQRVWRVPLTSEIMKDLHQAGGDDLFLVDSRDQAVPFSRLADGLLIEALEEVQALDAESAVVSNDQDRTDELELVLHHDGTRLSIRSPNTERRIDRYGELVFEALIGAPAALPELSEHRLELELSSPTPISLDCRLRDSDDDGPARQRVGFQEIGDSRPRHYRGRIRVESPLPEAWHLACYGNHTPAGLELVETGFVSTGQRNHRQVNNIVPASRRDQDNRNTIEFELAGPFRARALVLESSESNVVSRIEVFSRTDAQANWQRRGTLTLSTLDADQARLEFAGNANLRDRLWRLEADPVLDHMPDITFEAWQDELAFLARGEPPWRLYAGSRRSPDAIDSSSWLRQSVEQLGPAWAWPRIDATGRSEAGGPDVLDQPPPPFPWQRYLLWLVLIVGAAVVIYLAVSVLKKS